MNIVGNMSRRYCDKYQSCKDCACYSQYTDKLKRVMQENGYEEVEGVLKFADWEGRLTPMAENPKYKREWICMMHYYNPGGIYDENK